MSHRPLLALGSLLLVTAACSDRSTNPAGIAPRSAPLANANFKGGSGAAPSFTDLGLALQAAGAVSGLGNGDVVVGMKAGANVTASCTNPSGTSKPPGHTPATVTVTGGQAIPASAIKNGNAPFSVTSGAPATPIAGAPECPNTSWSEDIVDLAFTSAVITRSNPRPPIRPSTSC